MACMMTHNASLTPLAPASPPLDTDTTTATTTYAVYFNTLPVHLWGRRGGRGGRDDQADSDSARPPPPPPPAASAPARRVSNPWSSVSFVPAHAGEVVFVQGLSCRVLWAKIDIDIDLPRGEGEEGPRPTRTSTSMAPLAAAAMPSAGAGGRSREAGRFGLVDGARVVALDGHQAQVKGHVGEGG